MIDNTKTEEHLKKAQKHVYQLLKFRLRSEQELRDKLDARKLPTPIVEQTIQHFKAIRLIDDSQFAQQWTSSRLKKPFGLKRIRLELKQKGIDEETINNTLNVATRHYDELEIVTELALRRAQKYHDSEPEKVRQRIYGYLTRRGFNTSTIMKAVDRI